MHAELKLLLRRPELFERTKERFWNDPHISAGMLRAHLDPGTDAASRKPDFIDSSAEWICSLLPDGAMLLDIGCGPGLYAKRISDRGFHVTGLDFSERSISYAKEYDKKSEYVLMDYLDMEYDGRFDMITLIWCDYGALIPEERRDLLGRVFKALRPGGSFLFDVFTPEWISGRKESTGWEVFEHGGFWSPDPHICMNAEYYYGDDTGLRRTVVIEDDRVRCFNIWNKCFTRVSLAEELLQQGFAHVEYYSDVRGGAYEKQSKTLCAVAMKARSGPGSLL